MASLAIHLKNQLYSEEHLAKLNVVGMFQNGRGSDSGKRTRRRRFYQAI